MLNYSVVPGSSFSLLCIFDVIVSASFLKASVISLCRLCPSIFQHICILNIWISWFNCQWNADSVEIFAYKLCPSPLLDTSILFFEGTKLPVASWIFVRCVPSICLECSLAECWISLLYFTQILKMLPLSEDLLASPFIEVHALHS